MKRTKYVKRQNLSFAGLYMSLQCASGLLLFPLFLHWLLTGCTGCFGWCLILDWFLIDFSLQWKLLALYSVSVLNT